MVRVSVIYHQVIETCQFSGLSVLEYISRSFRGIVIGNHDYVSLLPQTIGLLPMNQ